MLTCNRKQAFLTATKNELLNEYINRNLSPKGQYQNKQKTVTNLGIHNFPYNNNSDQLNFLLENLLGFNLYNCNRFLVHFST